MRATFDAVQAATGIDLRGIIQGQATGRGIAQGLRNEETAATDAAPLRRRTAEPAAPAAEPAASPATDAPSPDAV